MDVISSQSLLEVALMLHLKIAFVFFFRVTSVMV